MERSNVLNVLRRNRSRFEQLGAASLYLYGSVARGDARPDSDIDLLVDGADDTFTAFDLIRVREACETLLQARVDLHDYGGYRRLPAFRERVGKDIVRVF